MAGRCDDDSKNTRDLTASPAAYLLWYVPIAAIIAGSFWTPGRDWLWASAFAVMGIGCVVNASRCQRLHCYFTGPLPHTPIPANLTSEQNAEKVSL